MYPIPNFSPEVWEGSLAWTLSSRALPRDGPDRRSRSARSTLSSNVRTVPGRESVRFTLLTHSLPRTVLIEVYSTGPVAQVARAHP